MSRADKASATSCNPCNTVCRYTAAASSYAATAERFRARNSPPRKIGCMRFPAMLQTFTPFRRSPESVLCEPRLPLNVILGKRSAVATPTLADA